MAMHEKTTYTFHVSGMHCQACTLLIEDALNERPEISSVTVDLGKATAIVEGVFPEASPEKIASELSKPLAAHGYRLSVEKSRRRERWQEFQYALPIGLGFIGLFILLQKSGIINLIGGGELGYGSVFFIGLIASVSTCMAVVGGLVLSMSAAFAKSGDRLRPQFLFHIGRLVAFFVLGGLIGTIGTAFTLSTTATFILMLVIGVVMVILGINLLDVTDGVKKLQFTMPAVFGRHIKALSQLNHTLTPFLVGVVTFFLPCGFTQSMQLYTLSTGGFLAGAMTMFVFALGTLPVLALVSFSSLSVAKSPHAGIFYKTAGIIVLAFALMNIINALVIMNVVPPLFNF